MPSLVLTPRLTNDSLRLEKAARELGWLVHRATRYRLPPTIEDPVVYGEITFCDAMAVELNLGLLEPSSSWLAELPLKYLRRRVRAMKHGNLSAVRERSFIKPANDKLFEAGIFERGSHVPYRYIDPEMPVLVSDVVSFRFELRCYVLDRKVLTAGVYAFSDEKQSSTKEQMLYELGCDWILGLLRDSNIQMPSAVVVDIGYIPEERSWSIVEANQAYASGVYTGGFSMDQASPGAEPREVLRVVERSAGLRSKVALADERWLRPLKRHGRHVSLHL